MRHLSAKRDDPSPKLELSETLIERSFFSYITFSWITPLLKRGKRSILQEEDLPNFTEKSRAHNARSILNPFWQQYERYQTKVADQDGKKAAGGLSLPSLSLTLVRHFLLRYIASLVLAGISVAAAIIQPLLIADVVTLLDPNANHAGPIIKTVWGYGLLYFGLSVAAAFATFNFQAMYLDMQVELRAIVVGAVYGKALRLSTKSQQDFGAGTVNSMINADVQLIGSFPMYLTRVITCTVQIILALYLLARLLGVTTSITAGAFVLLSVLTVVCINQFARNQGRYMKALDKRTKLLRELIYGIKSLKLEASEKHEATRIEDARNLQLGDLRRMIGWMFLVFVCVIVQQDFIPTITIIGYTQFGGAINATTVFPILGLLSALMEPSGMLGGSIMRLSQSLPSLKRVSTFLLAEEIRPDETTRRLSLDAANADTPAISLTRANFSWEASTPTDDASDQKIDHTEELAVKDVHTRGSEDKDASMNTVVVKEVEEVDGLDKPKQGFHLSDISLDILRGSLVAIVGPVGSGKSSMLSALVGAMRKTGGTATVTGSIGYCAQEPWVLSGTLEQNIRGFSGDLSQADVADAVSAVCLDRDIQAFPHGLGTRVGEKGISLSGGQKARLAIGRAIASNPDIYLLDDPLAALDAQVGKTIFEKTICGSMRGKTVLLATHQLHLISKADIVVVLNGGKVAESGSFSELMEIPGGVFANMMKNYAVEENVDDGKDTVVEGQSLLPEQEGEKALKEYEEQLAIAEDRQQGLVEFSVVLRYFKTGGFFLALLPLILFPIGIGMNSFAAILMVIWADNEWNWTDDRYFTLYYSIGIVKLFSILLTTVLWFSLGYRASKSYHHNALMALIRAPLGWFDGQPAGRIINRMTTDVLQLDLSLAQDIINLVDTTAMFLANVVIVAYGTPFILILFAVMSIPSVWAFRFFQASYRELKRLSSILKSPLAAHCSETFNGIPSIKAYRWETSFVARQEATTDSANKAILLTDSAKLWISLRMTLLTSVIVLASVMLAEIGVVDGSAAGLMLVGAINLGTLLNVVLLMIGMTEASFNAVERLDYYAGKLPIEKSTGTDKVDDTWPRSGGIVIENLEIRYDTTAESASPVLQNLSVVIRPEEKVAVCGRSGAGKSTLMLALFRIVEASKGTIRIDGQDISKIDLDTLRDRLQIIPQEPILFSGTFRSNVDRWGKRTDQEIWNALDMAGMKEYISSLPGQLEAEVSEGGSNMSSGQRQLIVLTKAILSNAKIIIMDEATAAVDHEADERIQEMISTHFKHCTVISIAHRLNTIAGFDKVLVLRDGRFVEFDSPHVLLADPSSLFTDLVEASGSANAAVIRDIVARHQAEQDAVEM